MVSGSPVAEALDNVIRRTRARIWLRPGQGDNDE